jgi:hypothetical protein
MTHLPLDPVQTAVLYASPDQMPDAKGLFAYLTASLNTELASETGMFFPAGDPEDSASGLIENPEHNVSIRVTVHHTPMDMASFADVLDAPYYRDTGQKLIASIHDHGGAIRCVVASGASALTSDTPPADPASSSETDGPDLLQMRLLIVQTLTRIICEMSAPTAVHWPQSRQLFTPQTFVKHACKGFNPVLYVACGAFSPDDDDTKIGITGHGSDHFIGHLVEFAATDRPKRRSYHSVLSFVAYCRQIGRVLKTGETFEEPNGDIITVHHEAARKDGAARIILRLHPAGRRSDAASKPHCPPAGFSRMAQAMDRAGRPAAKAPSARSAGIKPVMPPPASKRRPKAGSGDLLGFALHQIHSAPAAADHAPRAPEAASKAHRLPEVAAPEASPAKTARSATLTGRVMMGVIAGLCLFAAALLVVGPADITSLIRID